MSSLKTQLNQKRMKLEQDLESIESKKRKIETDILFIKSLKALLK